MEGCKVFADYVVCKKQLNIFIIIIIADTSKYLLINNLWYLFWCNNNFSWNHFKQLFTSFRGLALISRLDTNSQYELAG